MTSSNNTQYISTSNSSAHLGVPIMAVSTALAIAAAAATYLVLQVLQNGHLLSLSGIGVTPHNLTLYSAAGLYGLTSILLFANVWMLKNVCANRPDSSSSKPRFEFVRQFISNPSQVGAIAPSSHALAVQIVSFIPDRSKVSAEEPGKRYLEIGAGSGVFTREIVERLGPNDWLDVVEFDHKFCEQLRSEFGDNLKMRIHEKSIIDFDNKPYDVIISGLPLAAFEPEFVSQVLNKYETLCKPDGIVSYFEYIALGEIKKAFTFGKARERFSDVLAQKANFVKKHNATKATVLNNVPPARVQHCFIKKTENQNA